MIAAIFDIDGTLVESFGFYKEQIKAVRTKFGELIRQHLQNGGKCCPVKGAIHLIDKLLTTEDYEVGLATGGWRHTAKMKLQPFT